jgi:BNR repeat-containing family member
MKLRQILWVSWVALAAVQAAAQTNFATLATDGAWTWFNDPRALFHQGKLYFGYVRAGDSKTVLGAFNLATGQSTNLWIAGFTELDDHDNPGLLVKADGTMLAIYARHGVDQYFAYRRSTTTNPVSSADWAGEQTIPNSGGAMTYANPFQLSNEGGKIYNFCRNTNYNPTIFTSTDGGNSWSPSQHFIRTGTGGTRPYVKYCSDYNQRFDFLYTDGHPRDVANSLYHLYYQGGVFYQTDGTFVKNYAGLPLLHDSGERGSVIYQYNAGAQSDPNQWIPTGRAWCWEIAYQSNGAPVCAFTVQRDLVTGPNSGLDDRIYYYYARWTGTNWQKRFIAHAGRPLYVAEDDYAGGICLDPQNPSVIYISSNAEDPFNLADTTNVTLRANNRYEIWRGVTGDGGVTFAWTQITTNSTADNLRPYIPRRNGGEPCVIWFRGTYSSYTSYACSIVGLFTTQVPNTLPTNSPPATNSFAITYLDATSGVGGNTTLSDGSLFTPPGDGTTGLDNNWEIRNLGTGGNVYEAGAEVPNENAPEIRTTISSLAPGARYAIYAFFWDANGTVENWSIRAGLNSAPGANPLYSAADATGLLGAAAGVPASTLTYASAPPLFSEANRLLQAASLGTATADSGGSVRVFIDDKPSTIGANNRSWYDGVGWALLPVSYSTNLLYVLSGSSLSISWPASHLGWTLQTNAVSLADSNAWFECPPGAGSRHTNQITITIDPAKPKVFFRLAYP